MYDPNGCVTCRWFSLPHRHLYWRSDSDGKMRSAVAQMMPTEMVHLYWPSMIYENEHRENEECGCNTCDDLDGNVLYTICEVDEQDENLHDEPSGDVLDGP